MVDHRKASSASSSISENSDPPMNEPVLGTMVTVGNLWNRSPYTPCHDTITSSRAEILLARDTRSGMACERIVAYDPRDFQGSLVTFEHSQV